MTICANHCCWDEDEDITACEHRSDVFDFDYYEEMDPDHHTLCWCEWDDPDGQAETGCTNCDIGCKGLHDDDAYMLMERMSVDGPGFMRSAVEHPWGRDAQGRVFDLKSDKPNENHAVLIGRNCILERASCRENDWTGSEHNVVCFGHDVCQCTPGPASAPPCGDPPGSVQPNAIVPGLVGDWRFYNSAGWPPPSRGYGVSASMFCRKFLASESTGEFSVHAQHGPGAQHESLNEVFLRGQTGYGFDKLTLCAGRIANTTCVANSGFDCTYGDTGGAGRVNIVGNYINQHQASRGLWNEVRIQASTVERRMPANPTDYQRWLVNLHNEVLQKIVLGSFVCDPSMNPDGYVTFDRLQMPVSANQYLGYYERTWAHYPLDGYPETLVELPHSYTKWGRVPVHAHLCLTWIRIRLYLQVVHQGHYDGDSNDSIEWYAPYSHVEIEAKTGVWAEFAPGGPDIVRVNDEIVTIVNPAFGAQGAEGMPIVTPAGNGLVYCQTEGEPLLIPRWFRWQGRLGSFSDPVIQNILLDQENLPANCEEIAETIGQWSVPALPDKLGSKPDDPCQKYGGALVFEVVQEA